jgi:hypothetical protein
MPEISSDAWASIEREYRKTLAPDVRRAIERVTATFISKATADPCRLAGRPITMTPAIERVGRLRQKVGKLADELMKVPQEIELYADGLIAEHYRLASRTSKGVTPGLADVVQFMRACDYAANVLKQMQTATPGSPGRWVRWAWNDWVVTLSALMKRHGLPSGPGATETKDVVQPSRFAKLVQALQKHALPTGVRPRSMTDQAIEQAIKRAFRAARQGQN